MRIFSSFAILSTKLMYLICFTFMGFLGVIQTTDAEIHPAPCHQTKKQKQFFPAQSHDNKPCEACVESEKLWSCPFALMQEKVKYPDFSGFVLPFLWQNDLWNVQEKFRTCPKHDPPEKLSLDTITIKNTTQIIV